MYTVRDETKSPSAVVATAKEAIDSFDEIMSYAAAKLETDAVAVKKTVVKAEDCVVVYRRGQKAPLIESAVKPLQVSS